MAANSQTGRWVVMIAVVGSALLVGSVVATVMQNSKKRPVGEFAGEWAPGDPQYDVVVNAVGQRAAVVAGTVNGKEVSVRCDTCHAGMETNKWLASADGLQTFHVGLKFDHGKGALTCMACHNSEDYETLRKADGMVVRFSDSMQLCAQCHGRQYRDYMGGTHGGMTGYWDLQRGGRKRNHCIDCHDPHAPAFPQMMPMPPPMIRAGTQPVGGGSHH
ncbi:hypothetical protein [Sulfuriroseicoccus oceanibius]|uniref:Uncharacterized protein n=1 Tax=Sulfuriroseicoccus oceanibius TaxID=2707525 RepID=A0A6B3L8Z6_9BACT|nr:hypothetical protein [Sulfuriroseicoccus oceanibius]QQL44854.1 hypothetical protein G3M56_013405 [Sulfuriroseicoccus oceanibius]